MNLAFFFNLTNAYAALSVHCISNFLPCNCSRQIDSDFPYVTVAINTVTIFCRPSLFACSLASKEDENIATPPQVEGN